MAMRIRFTAIVGTALVAVLALSGVAWAATGPLAVTKTTPNGGATEVAPPANIKAYFNHDMRASTVTSSTFKIRKQGATRWLTATRSVNNSISPTSTNGGSQSVATLNPEANLAFDTTYQVVVVGGSSGVKDTDAKALSTNKSWTFTTVAPPETTIDSGPEDAVARDSASFSFSSSKSGSTFQCSLDGSAFAGCTSPQSYSSLSQGSHTFRVRAIDAKGNVDPTPASRSWTVDTIGPNASITDGPPRFTNSRSATFTFTGAEEGGGYQCNMNGPGPSIEIVSPCTSPKTEGSLADGTYSLTVWASDALGNLGTLARHTWTVDTVAPAAPSAHLDASSDSGAQNDNITKDNTPTISGTAEAGSTVKIYNTQNTDVPSVTVGNAGTWSYTFGALQDGSYSYTVKTTDAAGNESQGTSISLTIDTAAPETTLGDKPASPLNSGSATFTFSSSESGSSFECSRDDSAFAECNSPQSYTGLADGSHTFRVRAIDAAGNVDPTPASHTWTVETAAPTVNNVSPANTATVVAPSTNVRVTFSEAMDEASVVAPGTFTLKQGSSPVAATVTYDSATKKATLDPSTDLALNTTYTATLTTEAKDLAGNALAQERSWTFTTANAPRSVTVTPTTLDLSVTQSSLFQSCERSELLTVTNNGQDQVEFWEVSITGPDAQNFSTGSQNLLAIYDWLGLPGGYYFQDTVTFKAGQNPGDRSRSYFATLTYKDDTGATIGNPVTLTARAACLSVG